MDSVSFASGKSRRRSVRNQATIRVKQCEAEHAVSLGKGPNEQVGKKLAAAAICRRCRPGSVY